MIEWFARNGVSANFLMILIVVGGFVVAGQVRLELFPEMDLETIAIQVPYPGAAPAEVEEAICIRIEERIQDISGIRRLRSTASENLGTVTVEVERGFNPQNLLEKIKTRVDAIDTFPIEAEPPIVENLTIPSDTISVSVHGEVPLEVLRTIAEKLRDELTLLPEISQVSIQGIQDPEISIEVPDTTLEEYGLTFSELAGAIRAESLDLPGGVVRSPTGEVLLRANTLAKSAEAYAEMPVVRLETGDKILLGELAAVLEGFGDQPLIHRFNGSPAVNVRVFAVGDQSPIDISRAVYEHVEGFRSSLPDGVEVQPWRDFSIFLQDRLNLLIKNGLIGLGLVFVVLTLFLRPSLAFFVSLGIPVSFFGTLLLMPALGQSINLMTLFAFILVLGIVVDDAIVVGESVFSEFQKTGPGLKASVVGSKRVAMPVTFAVLTTVVAFVPVLFLPGIYGAFLFSIPAIVIPTLLFSLVQAKLILPYHLTLCRVGQRDRSRIGALRSLQLSIADGMEGFVNRVFRPFLDRVLRWRYLSVALCGGLLLICLGLLLGGWIRFVFPAPVPSDYIVASLRMPPGSPFQETERTINRMKKHLDEIREALIKEGLPDPVHRISTTIGGSQFIGGGPGGTQDQPPVTELGEIAIELVDPDTRILSAPELAERWREAIGPLPQVRDLTFHAMAGAGIGPAIEVQLQGASMDDLRKAAAELRERLGTYPDLYDIKDSFPSGKKEVHVKLLPEAGMMGFTQGDLARQVRQAFFGEEIQRIQRGRNDVRVMLRLPADQRTELFFLENLRVRSPDGRSVVVGDAARLEMGTSTPEISRVDRHRTVTVEADADPQTADLRGIIRELSTEVLPEIEATHPGVRAGFEGEERALRELTGSLARGYFIILIATYAMMAVPFKSYLQPLIVMTVIPFGIVGATIGHLITFQDFSLFSILGLVALTGVIINNSLVLVHFCNQRVLSGMPVQSAVREAALNRFRAILLTSLTTFVGLTPILLETNLQAQFLIPMASSLAFGILFSAPLTLILVPCFYLIIEDFRSLFIRTERKIPVGE